MAATFKKLEIPDIILITPKIFKDLRGSFFESYKYSEFIDNGINEIFVQDNCSRSQKGVLRGLHYQIEPFSQGKIVRCSSGAILDIAVDLRKSSNTFKKYVIAELTSENGYMLYIPAGFGHGFYTLVDNTEVSYKITSEYKPEAERGVIWNDPELNIDWHDKNPVLSEKDEMLPLLKSADLFE